MEVAGCGLRLLGDVGGVEGKLISGLESGSLVSLSIYISILVSEGRLV